MNQDASNLFKPEILEIGKHVFLHDTPLGRGGEGEVYEVIRPRKLKDYVVKVYHPQERTQNRESKILYMIGHPPQIQDELSIIWPKAIIYRDGKFVGFMMRRARGEYDLTILSSFESFPLDWEMTGIKNFPEKLLMDSIIELSFVIILLLCSSNFIKLASMS